MPTYEYKCQDCGLKFEKFQSMKDKPLEKCPECNGKVQRLIGGGDLTPYYVPHAIRELSIFSVLYC
jgi:putative FmdB family regulatory protein